ncbi:hypothetical protein D0466_21650 [Peribacillus glennii]|uniref:Uncharacterized protein n=1 Tax=Peribacillus glennii TaxID=2303991 RepID=A0A372L6U5_9BACI|nr:hypothetical protein D0466_21650 [Peribacillus glennii]
MEKKVISILIICLYSFPFAYYSMYQDYANHTMIGYLLMIVATSLLASFSKFFCNSIPLIIGNVISGIASCYFLNNLAGNEQWSGYFKPLTASQLLVLVSLINIIPQVIAFKIAKKKYLFN